MDIGRSMDWDGIVQELGPKLYRYFCARFEDVIADDLTQETLVRLVTKFDSGEFDNSRGTLEMFAFGIARFVRLEKIKGISRNYGPELDDSKLVDSKCLIELAEKSSELDLLRKGIGSLSEPEQEIILLMVEDEWNLQKISEHMEMPIGTIKSHIHRAKKNILNYVNEKGGTTHGRL